MFRSFVASRFKTTTAAGALAVALFAMPQAAYAADECGHLTRAGETTCSIDMPLPTGVEYFSDWGNITLHLEDGLTINPDAGYGGIYANATNGSVTIDGTNANVKTDGFHAIYLLASGDINVGINDVSASGNWNSGITTYTENGDTVIEANNITTSGHVGYGINAKSMTGDINIGVNSVTTDGIYSLGILAQSHSGNIDISAGSVNTIGFAADGITAFSNFGNINIEAGSISGQGDYIFGVNAQAGNHDGTQWVESDINVDVDNITIYGQYGIGVIAMATGAVDVKLDELSVYGDHGNGVVAMALFGDANVEVGKAEFGGVGTGGIVAMSEAGNASVKVGELSSGGGGMLAFSQFGNAYAEAGKVDISGDINVGVQAVSILGEKVTVKVGEVRTNGLYAAGVVATGFTSDVTVDVGKVTTLGTYSHGVQSFGKNNTINITGPIETRGSESFGILGVSGDGDVRIHTADRITTFGLGSFGMWVTGRGTADVNADGKITTHGDGAWGIYVDSEDGQIKLDISEIETSGVNAHGIYARSKFQEACPGQCAPIGSREFTSDIDIKVDLITVRGAGSSGITARGLGDANIDVGTVKSTSGYGIETNMIGDTSIRVRGSVTSASGSAILAEGENAFVNIISGASVAGGEHGIIVKAVGERCIMRSTPDGSANPCPNPGQDFNYPDPEPLPEIAGFATITNAGTISGGTGYAVKVENGTLTLNNTGTILGAVLLGTGDDVINNSGKFIVTKDSEFGAGNDTFKNNGLLSFGNSTTFAVGNAAEFTLVGLEKFENAGLVELRNGVAGDVLTLSGAYVGSGAGKIGLDVNFATGEADKLVVGGAATGTTELVLNISGGAARLSDTTDIQLVEVGFGSTPDAFKLAEDAANIGFIHYGLTFDDVSQSYVLNAEAGSGAYRQLNALEGLANNWHASANAVRTNIAAVRDDHWANATAPARNRIWGQVQTGKTKRDVETNGQTPVAYDYEQDRTGFQIGFDFAGSESDDSSFRFGVTAGYGSSDLDSRVVKEKVSYDMLNFGAYASLTSGNLFGSLLAKYDQQDVKFESSAAGFEAKADGASWGIELEGGAHFATGGSFFVEPLASLALTRTSLDEVNALGQTLDFDDADGVRGKLGVRFGGNSGALRYYGSAKAVHDFGGDNSLALVSGGETAELKADSLGTFVEGVLGASFATKGGLEAFVEGQGERGSDYDSVEGRVGVRFKL